MTLRGPGWRAAKKATAGGAHFFGAFCEIEFCRVQISVPTSIRRLRSQFLLSLRKARDRIRRAGTTIVRGQIRDRIRSEMLARRGITVVRILELSGSPENLKSVLLADLGWQSKPRRHDNPHPSPLPLTKKVSLIPVVA